MRSFQTWDLNRIELTFGVIENPNIPFVKGMDGVRQVNDLIHPFALRELEKERKARNLATKP